MRGVESGERQDYGVALAGVWENLAQTLARLDRVAADPAERLAWEESLAETRRLLYALHTAGELVLGIDPPPGSEQAHDELTHALADAREATAEVLDEVAAFGPEAAQPLVYEWRGALFRVRLARLRLVATEAGTHESEPVVPSSSSPRALAAVALALGGAIAVVVGAHFGLWPLWSAGLGSFLAAIPAYRA